jgi:hypothetical protein
MNKKCIRFYILDTKKAKGNVELQIKKTQLKVQNLMDSRVKKKIRNFSVLLFTFHFQKLKLKAEKVEILRKKRSDLVENMKIRNEESKQIESEILQKGLEIETVNTQNKNFINVRKSPSLILKF